MSRKIAIVGACMEGFLQLCDLVNNKRYGDGLTTYKDDEYVLILADRPTRVVLGKDNISLKFNILKSFDKALGQRQLTDFRLIDMRYNKQLVAKEWS